MTAKPIQATDTSTSSLSSWVQVPAAGGLAGGGDAPRNAEQRMEWELEKMKREANENVPAEPVAKRTKSPAMRSIGSVPLGVGVPLNPFRSSSSPSSSEGDAVLPRSHPAL